MWLATAEAKGLQNGKLTSPLRARSLRAFFQAYPEAWFGGEASSRCFSLVAVRLDVSASGGPRRVPFSFFPLGNYNRRSP